MEDFNVRLTAQIAELKQTLQNISASVVDQRHGLAQLTDQLKDSLGESAASALKELPNILKNVLHDQSVGAVLVGADGRYLLSNAAAESIFSSAWLRKIDLLSSEFGLFLSDKSTRCEHDNLPWQRCARGHDIEEGLFLVRRAEIRSEMWVRTISMPLRDEQGASKGAIAFLVDTTEQMQVEQQIKQLIFALEQQLASIEMAHLMLAQLTSKLLDSSGRTTTDGKPDMPRALEKTAPFQPLALSRPVVFSGVSAGVLSEANSDRSSVVLPAEIGVPQSSDAVKSLSVNEGLKSASAEVSATAEVTNLLNLAESSQSEFTSSKIAAPSATVFLESDETVKLPDGVEVPEQESSPSPESASMVVLAPEVVDTNKSHDVIETPKEETGSPPLAVSPATADSELTETPKSSDASSAMKLAEGNLDGAAEASNDSKSNAHVMTDESKAARDLASESLFVERPGEGVKKVSQPAAPRTRVSSQNSIKSSSGFTGAVERAPKDLTTLSNSFSINEKLLRLTKKVLIVDDTPVNQKLLRLQLRQLGLNIEVACNGKEAIEALSSKHFDLVFMDMDMPIMDGPTATAAIRKAEEVTKKHVPIIAMTSYDRDSDRAVCLDSGMDDYLVKGVAQKQLAEVVAKFLQEANGDIQPDFEYFEANVSAVDLESLRKMLGTPELEEIFSLFSSSLSTFLECMQLAIEEKNADAVTQFAHCIKGPASIMNLGSLTAPITDLMDAARDADWIDAKRSYSLLRLNFAEILKHMKQLLNED